MLLTRTILLIGLMLLAAVIDYRRRIIPNRLVAVGMFLGLSLGLMTEMKRVPEVLAVAVSVVTLLLLIRWVSRKVWGEPGLGMGDVKLAGMMAVFAGWEVVGMLYIAVCLGALFGMAGRVAGRLERRTKVPFAPFMLAGAVTWML